MFDQMFKDWERAAEASRDIQHEMFRYWTQPWLSAASNVGGADVRAFQKRCTEVTIEMLTKQRESLDSIYSSGIQVIEQAFRASEAKSPEEYRKVVEDLWRQMLETFKTQSETQLRDLQKWAEKSFEMAQKVTVA